ncbi:MAG TPA: WYL domain-containing protein [Longimicrobiaceae bacterium]|nr:WYL domain-containing protein [Longimicrobiaceae bacterium]
MAERRTAEAQLSRVLQLLPRAARAGGIALAELASEAGMSEREVLADLQEVYTRDFYHPAGSGDGVQVSIEADQVEVWTTGEFRRPPRLGPREALALGLGLRVLAAESPAPERPAMLALAQRLERELAARPPGSLLAGIAVNPGADSPEGIRAVLREGARGLRRCRIAYLKPGAPEPEERVVDPYVLLAAEGHWYLVAHCHRSDEVRVFRADRVVGATILEERFAVPQGFDPLAYVRDGRVFQPVDDVEVPVRYTARIARWIEEHGPVERQDDGSVIVRHRVSDPAWLVRHVLRHGPDAEVLGPPEMRDQVRATVLRLIADS